MSYYYLRAEDKDGNLLVGTEMDRDDFDAEYEIERLALTPGDKIKLYDLGNPTDTITVEDPDDQQSNDRNDDDQE
jgi:hypothetical protein